MNQRVELLRRTNAVGAAVQHGPEGLSHVALIGNALPRRCGLATFTSHVGDALRSRFPHLTVDHYAMDDGTGVEYPAQIHPIRADDPAAYREAAGLIEISGAQAIWVQHEFGIFGGEAGRDLLTLLDRSTLPVMATLHTVLEKPSSAERQVFDRLLERCSHVEVMAERGRNILIDVYGLDARAISVNPHGVPDRPYVDPDSVKSRFGLTGRKVVMTFGLLAPNKGIRFVIEALPAIVKRHPDACYVVIGATHPNLIRKQGEAHRAELKALAADLGVGDHLRWVDAFLEQDDLLDWIEAADVYVTPYLNLNQITSGTLSYAVALGKPVVSTPYVHATEILADDHGLLVPPSDSGALANAIGGLLGDDPRRAELARRAYERGRAMLWPRSAERSVAALEAIVARKARQDRPAPLPAMRPNIGAVLRMTDGTGILQHAIHSVPDRRHGYCIDDNARALMLACAIERGADAEELERLAWIYAAFVQHAWNADVGRFRNFMTYDRSWAETQGSEDSNGRALWALGFTVAHGRTRAMRDWASALFETTAPIALRFKALRAHAFAALGAAELIRHRPRDENAPAILELASCRLVDSLGESRRDHWNWFEPTLSYDNARLPEALIRAGMALGQPDLIASGLGALDWLVGIQSNPQGAFRAVGNDSFGRRYTPPLPFDQQPLDALATIDACAAALAASGDERWAREARRAYGWFRGDNDLGAPLASRHDGGCYDGLEPHGVNRNQGAESILALQMANVTISALSLGGETAKKARDAA